MTKQLCWDCLTSGACLCRAASLLEHISHADNNGGFAPPSLCQQVVKIADLATPLAVFCQLTLCLPACLPACSAGSDVTGSIMLTASHMPYQVTQGRMALATHPEHSRHRRDSSLLAWHIQATFLSASAAAEAALRVSQHYSLHYVARFYKCCVMCRAALHPMLCRTMA